MTPPDFEKMASDWVLSKGEFNVKWLDDLARHAYAEGLRRAVKITEEEADKDRDTLSEGCRASRAYRQIALEARLAEEDK